MTHRRKLLLLVLAWLISFSTILHASPPDLVWSRVDGNGKPVVLLHFFWSKTCPHCRNAKPFVQHLADSNNWLDLQSYELSENEANAERFIALTDQIGNGQIGVPAFVFCNQILVGYQDDSTTGALLQEKLLECKESLVPKPEEDLREKTKKKNSEVVLPAFGRVSPEAMSLPVFTLVIAGLDAFNPCAFFVLLLLLSLLANTRNRRKMLLIGGIFVFISGLVYYLFMAVWLNVFLFLGELRIISIIAGLLALVISLINIKDYFAFKKGPTLSIPESAKPDLYEKIRKLVLESKSSMMIPGTILLAVAANSYELLCTSGFPMIYTRLLTLHKLETWQYHLYLVFYNLIYILPLLLIVVFFIKTLGTRKLSEKEGRVLKLVSGLMMLELALLLLTSPQLLSHYLVAIALIAVALGLTWLIVHMTPQK